MNTDNFKLITEDEYNQLSEVEKEVYNLFKKEMEKDKPVQENIQPQIQTEMKTEIQTPVQENLNIPELTEIQKITLQYEGKQGRHPKLCECKRCIESKKTVTPVQENKPVQPVTPVQENKPVEPVTPVTPVPDKLDETLKAYKETTPVIQPVQTVQPVQRQYISGYLLLIITDAIFPRAMLYIFSMFDRKYRHIKPTELKFTAEEKKELAELADESAKYLQLNLNPVWLFLFMSGFIYMDKIDTLCERKKLVPEPVGKKKKENSNTK